MIDLAAREEEIMSGLKDFQRATVERVVSQFKAGQRQVLVADEVGLGKTLIAKGVIAKVARWHKNANDKIFRVVYICSNQSIARQNVMKLKIDKEVVVDTDTSTRLTMQTLKYFQQENDPNLLRAFVQLIPLTPSTSFASTNGGGIREERALIFAILRRIPMFGPYEDILSELLSMGVSYWDWYSKDWIEGEIALCGAGYAESVIPKVEEALNSPMYSDLRETLLNTCEDIRSGRQPLRKDSRLVHRLRRLMAEISISYLDPDLVIMDEFQRFRTLIRTDEQSEIGMLSRKFLHESGCKVLLLSATPYKLYAPLEEITENDDPDSHYREFNEVISFLFRDHARLHDSFKDAWNEYSATLRRIGGVSVEEYLQQKSRVEGILYKGICRTERMQAASSGRDMVRVKDGRPLAITSSDIESYIAADRIVQELSKLGKTALPPVEYVKSAPFILSFMEQYQLKRLVKSHSDKLLPLLRKSEHCWIPRNSIEQYRSIQYPNARLNRLLDEAFAQHGEQLLWIPATLPYYQHGGPFKGTEGFSKILVFSAWEMAPRMIASLVSYEAERRTIGDPSYQPRSETAEKCYSPSGENQHRFPSRKLEFRAAASRDGMPESMALFTLLYPCRTLADLFNLTEMAGGDTRGIPLKRTDVEHRLRSKLKPTLETLNKYKDHQINRKDKRWYWVAPLLLDIHQYGNDIVAGYIEEIRCQYRATDGENVTAKDSAGKQYLEHLNALHRIAENPDDLQMGAMPGDLTDMLVWQSLGSPAVCGLRMLLYEIPNNEGINDQLILAAFHGAHTIAAALRAKFNTPEATAIVDRCYKNVQGAHWRSVLRYCTDGNLQSVLDEYSHMLRDSYALHEYAEENRIEELSRLISQSLRTTTASYKIDTYASFASRSKGDTKSLRMRSHYAVGFYNIKSDNTRDVQRTDQLRQSFNSPFWPFVLASTSIGQEGLDFHYYCRKICHWNLPSNPTDLEQREGRINRYKSLAVRQNAVSRYRSAGTHAVLSRIWDDVFQACERHKQDGQCDLIPYWYLEPDAGEKGLGHIERIVPMYPFSKDQAQYERLKSILALYRITMGQPHQEELLESISQHLNTRDRNALQELFILLSPYYRERVP